MLVYRRYLKNGAAVAAMDIKARCGRIASGAALGHCSSPPPESEGKITLDREKGELDPISGLGTALPSIADLEPLSLIIHDVNERYGTEFSDTDKVILNGLQTRLIADQTLVDSAKVSSKENVRLVLDNLFVDAMQDLIDSNFELYKRVTDDAGFSDILKSRLFDLLDHPSFP